MSCPRRILRHPLTNNHTNIVLSVLSFSDKVNDIIIDYGYTPLQDEVQDNKATNKGLTCWKIYKDEKEYSKYQGL